MRSMRQSSVRVLTRLVARDSRSCRTVGWMLARPEGDGRRDGGGSEVGVGANVGVVAGGSGSGADVERGAE